MTQRLQIGFVFVILHISFGYLMYPRLTYSITSSGHWGVVLSYGLLQWLLLFIYKKGLNTFPKKDIIDIFLSMGKWAAIIFLFPYVINLTLLTAVVLRSHAEDVSSIFLIRTPISAILILFFSVSVYTAIQGLGTILRASVIFFCVINTLVIFVLASAMINTDFHNALPAWPTSLHFLWNVKFIYLMGFSSILFLGFVPAETNMKFSQLSVVWACVILFLLAGVYLPLLIFGQETASTFLFPVKEAADTVDISWFVFSRQTIFFGLSLIGFHLILIAVQLWMIGRIMQKLINSKRNKASYWIFACSLIAFIIAVRIPNREWIEKLSFLCDSMNVYFILILPLAIFLYSFFGERETPGYVNKQTS